MALTEAQHEKRRKGLGGSDAAKIMYGDYKVWKALYEEKVNGIREAIPPDRQLMIDVGNAVEPLLLAWFDKKVPLKKLPPEYMVHWKLDPFFFFTPDGITAEYGLGVQAKVHFGDKNIIELAEYYAPQCLHEMMCLGTRKHYLPVFFGHYGRAMHIEIEFDDEAFQGYMVRAMQFKEYLETGQLPADMADEAKGITIPRRRDHVWDTGDNVVAPLARDFIASVPFKLTFEDSLEQLKALVPKDAQTAKWLDADGSGLEIKVAKNNAKRWFLITPKAAKDEAPKAVRAKVGKRLLSNEG